MLSTNQKLSVDKVDDTQKIPDNDLVLQEKATKEAALIIASQELAFQNGERHKRAAELIVASQKFTFENEKKESRALELIIINRENDEKIKSAAELIIANRELAFQNSEKEKRAEELIIANDEKEKRAMELIIANNELIFQNYEKEQRALELILVNKELAFQNVEKEKRAAELIIANKELAFQNHEKAQRALELIVAHEELAFQSDEKEKRAAESMIANKELTFQNREKQKRAEELIVANEELAHQNSEREKRASELILANQELAFQNQEKEKRAKELIIANEELAFQNEEKEKRASELTLAIKELAFQNQEKEKRASELIIANRELAFQNEEKRKRAEELIASTIAFATKSKKSEVYLAHLAAIVEFSEDAIISKNLTGIISSWNKGAERMFGFTASEAIGNSISIIIPSEYMNEEKSILKRLNNNEAINHFETVRTRKGGERFDVSLTVSPMKDDDGNIIGVSKIARDITLSKKFETKLIDANTELTILEKQLKVTNKELEAFSYSVSHDLRIPLRAISGYSAMLKEDYEAKLDAEGKRIIDVIVDKTNMMSQLIDDLLSFSKMARLEVVTESIDMNKVVETCTSELLKIETGTKYVVTILQLPECRGDTSMLKQVWYNLISNALKYSSKISTPKIEAGAISDSWANIYYIKDNGAGFDMKYAKNLFGVFQRLHRQDEFEGTGIGLALVKRIVSKHGGEVWAESKVNEGATFYFSIPKQRHNEQQL